MENKTNELEKLNETLRDILKVLIGIYVSLEKTRDGKLDEEDILFPFFDELQGSSVQVCAKCTHFNPETKVCDWDNSRFEQNCENRFHCPMFNHDPRK